MALNRYCISLGSNIEPLQNLQQAKQMIQVYCSILAESSTVVSEPEGFKHQPDFHNCALLLETEKTVNQLKDLFKKIENQLHRVRTSNKNGSRTIDIDITSINGIICNKDYDTYWFVKQTVDEILLAKSKNKPQNKN